VLINITKRSLFSADDRVDMLRQVTSNYGNVRIERFHGLLVDLCAANGISATSADWSPGPVVSQLRVRLTHAR
jgi:phosphopantetheine adenylyltransferase